METPELRFLKVNVDGSFLRSSSQGVIEGLIRDLEGRILIQFCKEMWVDLVVHTEVLVLRERLLIAVASHWVLHIASFFNQTPNPLLYESQIPCWLHGDSIICSVIVALFLGLVSPGLFLTSVVSIMARLTH